LFSFEKSCLGEDPEVVTDGRLRKPERLRQVADADLPCPTDQAEESQTRRVGNNAQGAGQSLRRRLIERRVQDSRTTLGVDRLDQPHRHRLTVIDTSVNVSMLVDAVRGGVAS